MMGALPDDEDARDDEKPRHGSEDKLRYGRDEISCYAKVYDGVMGRNLSHFKGVDRPVEDNGGMMW